MEEQYMNNKRVMIQEIVDFFKLEQVTGNVYSMNRWIVVPDVNRPGLELAGFNQPTEPRRLVIIGNKELDYIALLSEEEQRERYQYFTDALTPMIVMTRNNPVPPILKTVAEERNFPIFRTALPTFRFMVDVISFLDERLAEEETLSGELLRVYGKGVLLTGESGVGKSETALELIRDGAVLVADDRVDVMKVHNELIGSTTKILQGMLEIRGIGIIDIRRMFGSVSYAKSNRIDLVIHMVPFSDSEEYDRIGDELTRFTKILDTLVPTIELPVSAGRSTRALVETAVHNFVLRTEEHYDSTQEFKDRLHNMLVEMDKQNGSDL